MNVIMNTTHVNILDVFNSIFYEDIEKLLASGEINHIESL